VLNSKKYLLRIWKYRFFPVGVDPFPTELSGGSAISFLRQGQVRKPSPGTHVLGIFIEYPYFKYELVG
ncbi:hypothetical protein, partial [Phocaeicola vulgatus]